MYKFIIGALVECTFAGLLLSGNFLLFFFFFGVMMLTLEWRRLYNLE